MRLRAALLALALVAVVAAPAHAATPFRVANAGGHAEVAVDANGTGHFVWNEGVNPGADVTHYCQVPRGQTTCSASKTFVPTATDPSNNEDFDGPDVLLPSPGTVIVVTHRCCGGFPPAGDEGTIAYVSTDGGQNFGAQQVIGNSTIHGDVILGPGGAISGISDVVTAGTFYQAMALGSFASNSANLGDGGPSRSYGGTLALVDANTPIAAFFDIVAGRSTAYFRRWSGSGDYNSIASWQPTQTLGPADETHLAGGPAGVFILLLTGTPGRQAFVLRRYDGSTFGAPTNVSETGSPVFGDLFEDGSGVLHALWTTQGGSKGRILRYRYTVGTSLSPIIPLVESSGFFNPQLATTADGRGFAVWDSNGDTGPLEAVPISPAVGEKPTSITVGTTVITLLTPRNCVPATDRVVARLRVRAKKRKGRVTVKVRKVLFSVDTRLRKTDTRAPFKATLTITGLRSGSTHRIRARVFIKVHHGPRRTRSIRSSFKVC